MGFKKKFPYYERTEDRILTGMRLLRCMADWSDVDTEKVIGLVLKHRAQFIIEEGSGLLMVEVPDEEKYTSLNKALISMGKIDFEKGAELSMPTNIWPDYKPRK